MSSPQQLTWIASIQDVVQDISCDITSGIRRVVRADKMSLGELYFAAYPRTVVATLAEAHNEFVRTFAGEYGQLDLDSSTVVELDGHLVAAVLTVDDALWTDTPPGPFIIEVMVHPDYRRQHLALRCLLATASILAQKNQTTVALRVMSDNGAAKKLYKRLGFSSWQGCNKSCNSI